MTVKALEGILFSGQTTIAGQPRAGVRAAAMSLVFAGLLLGTPSLFAVQSTSKSSSSSSATSHSKKSKRFAKWSPMFPGSHDKLVEQNVELNKSQVQRMNNEFDLVQSEMANDLVPVNETEALKVADNLADTHRYCRPWTRDFLQDFSQAYYNVFHQPLQVNSLVRTANQQAWLRRHNRFAAPAFGDTASTHLAGVSVDLSRRGLSNTQYQWIRGYLQPLQQKGMVDPIEERQPVLHIVVFEKYSDKYIQPRGNSEASEATEADLLGFAGSQP
jgi:hypothetical protein